jgi:hypothetical protein
LGTCIILLDGVSSLEVNAAPDGKFQLCPRHTDIVLITLGFDLLFEDEGDDLDELLNENDDLDEGVRGGIHPSDEGRGYGGHLAVFEGAIMLLNSVKVPCSHCINSLHLALVAERKSTAEADLLALLDASDADLVQAGYSNQLAVVDHLVRLRALFTWLDAFTAKSTTPAAEASGEGTPQ